jgi:hypothetical protein
MLLVSDRTMLRKITKLNNLAESDACCVVVSAMKKSSVSKLAGTSTH